jgi:hypothetical protein
MAATAPARSGFAQVATALGMVEATRRALRRHRAAQARARSLCEDLAERLGWLQRPDDPDRVAAVITMIGNEAAALEVCVGRLSGQRPEVPPPTAAALTAIVDVIDAEMRLADLGDRTARRRAQQMASALTRGARMMARQGPTSAWSGWYPALTNDTGRSTEE